MVYALDPLSDPRWAEFVDRHSSSSVFHSVPWLRAIHLTYGYSPIVYTTSKPASVLTNGVVLCQIRSWLTGRRMVSLPFSDHCEPLIDDESAGLEISNYLKAAVNAPKNWRYIELRPMSSSVMLEGGNRYNTYCFHVLDLRPKSEKLFQQTHRSCVQRAIKRAQREALVYDCGNSEQLLNAFYRLMVQTRRRQQLPPQPLDWFQNLIECMGNRLKIRVVFKNGREIASIVTVEYKNVIVYKYGCSDTLFQNLGGTQLLFWNTILEAKAAGFTTMDFGRSDEDNSGLIAFKERWGTTMSKLTYLRWSRQQVTRAPARRPAHMLRRLFAMMPDVVLQTTGRVLYRHVG
jgi:hypothetical protein